MILRKRRSFRLKLSPFLWRVVFVCLFGWILQAGGQPLLWPTDASRLITSSFGEFRTSHFHAGIDIKTWGRTGYRVYAINDGYVKRIQVSPTGYGRVLYFSTIEGWTAVYAHLEGFAEALEKTVREEQFRRGRFSVTLDFPPYRFPFKKGEVLGYTGESGAGPPHLHFEIRDPANRPLNPFLCGYRVEDTLPPRIRAMAVSPLSFDSRVNGDAKPLVVRAHLLSKGRYHIPETLSVWGDIGFSVSAIDHMDSSANALSVYTLALWIDSKRVVDLVYDRFPYEKSRQILIHRDPYLLADGYGEFHRLWRSQGNTLSFYRPDLPRAGVLVCGRSETDRVEDGSILLPAGEYPFQILVSDFWGNQAEVCGRIHIQPALWAASDTVSPVFSMPWPAPDDLPSAKVAYRFYDGYLRFAIEKGPFIHPLRCFLFSERGRHQVALYGVSHGGYAGTYPLTVLPPGRWTAVVVSPTEGPVAPPLEFPLYAADISGGEWTSPDRRFRVRFTERSLFAPAWGTILRDTLSFSGGVPVYHVLPEETPLDGYALVQFAGMDFTDPRWAVYRIGRGGKPVHLGRILEGGVMGAHTRQLGRFTVLKDTVPPEIVSIRPQEGAVFRAHRPRISVRFRDRLSGIGDEDDYRVFLDDRRLIMEYDPEKEMAFYPFPLEPLEPGEHRLTVEIKDRAGNVARRATRFRILSP